MELSWRLGGDIGDFLFGDGKTQKNGEFDGLEWHFMGVDWNSMGVFFVFFWILMDQLVYTSTDGVLMVSYEFRAHPVIMVV